MYDRRARRTSPADAVRARASERKDKEQNRSGGGRGGFLMQGARTRGRKGGKAALFAHGADERRRARQNVRKSRRGAAISFTGARERGIIIQQFTLQGGRNHGV